MANRLAQETSPYLLQHRDNPVDWYPWGEEALARARERGPPDPALGRLLGLPLVPRDGARVLRGRRDRRLHERALRQRQGRPRGAPRRRRPLHGGGAGDQRPGRLADDRLPRPRGRALLRRHLLPARREPRHAELPHGDGSGRRRLRAQARGDRASGRPRCAPGSARSAQVEPAAESPEAAMLEEASSGCATAADRARGGFGGAPKFPPASALELLLARGEREIVEQTLDAMLAGGIYDQLGGGFARYSVDAAWLVPHFEKMLYDNALLARAYLHGWQALGHERYRRVCEETLDWALREMRGPEGGFYSALDADSEGEEGRFYVWTPDADPRGARATAPRPSIDFYGVSEARQLRGRATSSTSPAGPSARRARGARRGAPGPLRGPRRARLARPRRQAPHRLERADDRRPGRGRRRARARRTTSTPPAPAPSSSSERAARRRRPPAAHLQGRRAPASTPTSRTTPSCSRRCSTLYEATFEPRWFERARDARRDDDRPLRRPRARRLLLHLRRPRRADRPPQGDRRPPDPLRQLRRRPRPAAPRGADRRARLRARRPRASSASSPRPAAQHPESFAHLLRAIDFHLAPTKEVALVGDDLAELAARRSAPSYRPHLVLAGGPEGSDAPAAARATAPTVDGQPAAYVCENFACQAPVTDAEELAAPFSDKDARQCAAPSSPSPPVAARSGSSSRSGSWRSSSPPARPTCRASSKTPKATRRPPTCRATPNRPRP